MKWSTGSWRLRLFRVLIAIAAGLMVVAFINPWWDCHFYHWMVDIAPIKIYSYGLRHSFVELRSYIAADETPFYQTMLAWIYLAASVGLILFSTWLKGRKGVWLLGGIGLIFIAYAAITVIRIAIRTGDFGISLQGWSMIGGGEEAISVFTSLRFGYYLAHASGLMCIVLALFRDKMVGKTKPGT